MNSPTSEQRAEMVAEIHEAFGNVTRTKDAISWSECVALDNYESERTCLQARQSDSDVSWTKLVDDEFWEPFPGIGGFSFINFEGFRYYLPATMIRFVRGDNSEWYPGHLLGVINRFTSPDPSHSWSPKQLACIAHFFRFMSVYDEETQHFMEYDGTNEWETALNDRWSKFESS